MKKYIGVIGTLFSIGITAQCALILSDSFSYPDGPLVGAAGSPWVHHSGSITGEVDVAAHRLFLTQQESEDVSAPLAGGPYAVTNPATLYASFTVNFSALPTKAGAYFAHFKDASTGFRARLFASTNGAAPGCARLAIANAASDPTAAVQIPADLNLNMDYLVVMSYDVTRCASALWLNPTAESDPAAWATDTASSNAIAGFAFRQSLSSGSGMGGVFVADLRVGTRFADVVPGLAPSTSCSLTAVWSGAFAQITLTGEPGRSYAIEASDDLAGWNLLDTLTSFDGTARISDATASSSGARFYRARLVE